MIGARRDAWPAMGRCAALVAGVPRAIIVTALGAGVLLVQAASTAWASVRGVVSAQTEAPRQGDDEHRSREKDHHLCEWRCCHRRQNDFTGALAQAGQPINTVVS